MRIISIAAAALATVGFASIASAATFVVDFDDLTAPGFTGDFTTYTTGVSGIAAAPNATPFLAVPGDRAGSGAADYEWGVALLNVSFDWGTPDTYNTLTFFSGNTVVGPVYTGAGRAAGNYSYSFLATDNVTRVNFASSSRAFEIDNLSVTTVPEPAAWALLLVGFALVGTAARRRSGALTA